MVMASNLKKIGTVEIITVKTHARELYLPLNRDLTDCFGIKKGDRLRIKIEGKIIQEDTQTE